MASGFASLVSGFTYGSSGIIEFTYKSLSLSNFLLESFHKSYNLFISTLLIAVSENSKMNFSLFFIKVGKCC